MLGGKLCANISPYRMLPLTHGRGQRIFDQLCRLRRPAVRACTETELTTYARAPCAGRLWSSISRRVFQRGGLSQRGARVAARFSISRELQISRVGVFASVAALRMRLRAIARCSDKDLGRDQHERALNFPKMCGLLCGSVAERSADDCRRATAVAKKSVSLCRCGVRL